jgi:hypothetical protein
VPGTATLNAGGTAHIYSISCASAGNCSGGGYYTDDSGAQQAFVVDETDGTWGDAEEVPGTATLNIGGGAFVWSVSCASAGNCGASGSYASSSGPQDFVVDETDGTWGNAEEIPGTATLNVDGIAEVGFVSCTSAGNCSVGGGYLDGSNHVQAFVVDETDGTWGNAEEVPGMATLNTGGDATFTSPLSCTSAGNCSAGGSYSDSGSQQAFVVDETDGAWGNAEEVPGMATINSVSCTSAGNCSAAGGSGSQAFVVGESDGTWGDAEEVPGTATLNAGHYSILWSLSCTSPGNCSAGGWYTDASDDVHPMIVDETGGTWGNAEEVPGAATLNAGNFNRVWSLSCSSAGNCVAGGTYIDRSGATQAFVVDESDGTWGNAEEIPGTATLNADGDAEVGSVSCSSDGSCSVGGVYRDGSGKTQVFVDTYGPALPTVTRLSPASGPIKGGTLVTVYGTDLTGASAVDFGSDPGTHVTVVNNDELTVSAPAGSAAVDVTVTTPGGTSAVSSEDRYTYVPLPTVNALTPTSGPASGGTVVTVYGINFVEPSSVRFGTDAGTHVTIVNSGELKVTAPAGSGTVNVTVATPGGTSTVSGNDRYSYFARPIVNGISPASGRKSGGTVVTVYGINFGGPAAVWFGTDPGTHVTIVNSGELKVISPAGIGTVNVTVATPGGTSAVSSSDHYKYT